MLNKNCDDKTYSCHTYLCGILSPRHYSTTHSQSTCHPSSTTVSNQSIVMCPTLFFTTYLCIMLPVLLHIACPSVTNQSNQTSNNGMLWTAECRSSLCCRISKILISNTIQARNIHIHLLFHKLEKCSAVSIMHNFISQYVLPQCLLPRFFILRIMHLLRLHIYICSYTYRSKPCASDNKLTWLKAYNRFSEWEHVLLVVDKVIVIPFLHTRNRTA